MNRNGEDFTAPEEDVGVTKEYLSLPLFEEGSARLSPEDGFKGLILRWPALTHHVVRIVGYADVEREDEPLARMRAETVHRFLLQRGIAPDRFDAVSWQVHGPPSEEQYRPQYRRASVLAYNALLGPDEWQHYFGKLHNVHAGLPLGASEDAIYDLVLRVLTRRMKPGRQLPEIDLDPGDSVMDCPVDHPFDNRQATLCALMSSAGQLKDLWLQEDALGILPLKRGVYDRRLGTIQPGAKVEELYALLGKRAPQSYSMNPRGNRIVDFRYRGFGRDVWEYRVDAATGNVTRVLLRAD